MSVIKNLRNLSKMEFYHTALVLRDMLTKWLMKEFGIKPSYKEYELRASDISPEDLAAIDSIYEKYGINRKKAYASVYPQWLSFRGNIRRYNSYRIINSLDRYFSSIYGEEMENISVGDRYGRKNQRTGE